MFDDDSCTNRACLYNSQPQGTFCQIVSCSNQGELKDSSGAQIVEVRSSPFSNPSTMSSVVQAPLQMQANGSQLLSRQQLPSLLSFTPQKEQLYPKNVEVQDSLTTLAVNPLLTTILDGTVQASSTCQESTVSPVSLLGNETVVVRKETSNSYHNGNLGSLGNVNTNYFTKTDVPSFLEILDGGVNNHVNNIVNVEEKVSCVDEKVKDRSYWKRRERNNLAAKRSRAARREREMMNQNKIEHLRQENQALRLEVIYLRKENACLRGYLP